MTDAGVPARRTSARASSSPPPETSVVPGRIRIVAWILLATTLGLTAVVLTLRSSALAEVEREANDDVVQEADEFRTFAAEGVDPETGQAPADARRLLELHLRRQFPGRDELMLGFDASRSGASALIVQEVDDPVGLLSDLEAVRALALSDEASGVAETDDGVPYRWGTVAIGDAVDPDGVFVVAESTAADRAEVDRQTVVVIGVCLGGLLITAAIAWVAAGGILRPVRDVRRAAARITSADLDERIPVTGRDDVSALAQTFNGMLDRLQQAFDAQNRFATSAGNHLRPALSTLRDRVDDPEALAAVRRMELILDDLGVLAGAEQDGFLAPREVRTADLVDALRDRVVAEVGTTHRVVLTEVEHPDEQLLLDPGRIQQAMVRLARNAAREAPEGSTITLSATVDDESVELALRDEGHGLTAAQAAAALDRAAPAPTGAPDGSGSDDLATSPTGPGLGLAVVRAVADAHQGSLWVESEIGRGSSFGMTLPRGQSPRPEPGPERRPDERDTSPTDDSVDDPTGPTGGATDVVEPVRADR